jgi:N-acetylglucosaminyldiphosphoundecaprenol N-acetyl-beta-D-mannosaminyltransferase
MTLSKILGVNIATIGYAELVQTCTRWAKLGQSHSVFFATVHMLMEAHDAPMFRDKLNKADIVNPDGMPLVWGLRMLGHRDASRVYGPDTTEALLLGAQESKIPIGFYGGTEATLVRLVERVKEDYPGIRIVFTMSPPFRLLSSLEDQNIVQQISDSGARFLFVGLGCPKQENWVIDHQGRVPAVMLAVGAAFDFLAGTKPQAPRWMMRNGLEWLFRMVSEPRRLAGRYLKHNPRFLAYFFFQWMTRGTSTSP